MRHLRKLLRNSCVTLDNANSNHKKIKLIAIEFKIFINFVALPTQYRQQDFVEQY